MKRVYCLYRVSTKKQVDVNKDDIPMQKTACREFANQQQGWMIVQEFTEKGVSGFKVSADDRDVIQDLKQAATNKEFDILLVFMFDRIGRIESETPFVVKWFADNGIEVWSAREGQQRFDNHVDSLINYMRYWQASGESMKTSERVKTRIRQLVSDGCFTGGVTPFGYSLVCKGRKNKKGVECKDLVINESEAKYVRQVFDMTVKEGYGTHQIAAYLNSQGLKTHNGADFQCNTVNRILKNYMYIGRYKRGELISPRIEELAIISEEVFNRAGEILAKRGSKNQEKRNISMRNKSNTLLSGNIYCAHCWGRLTPTAKTEKWTHKDGTVAENQVYKYYCYNRNRKSTLCDGQHTYLAKRIDPVVMSIVKEMFQCIKTKPEVLAIEKKLMSEAHSEKQIKSALEKELRKEKANLDNLQVEIIKSLNGESHFKTADLGKLIEKQKEKVLAIENNLLNVGEIINQQVQAHENILFLYNEFKGWAVEFDDLPIENKKMIIGQLVHKVFVGKDYAIKVELNLSYMQFTNNNADIP